MVAEICLAPAESTPVFQCRQSAETWCVAFTFRWIQKPRNDKMMEDKIMLVVPIILSLIILTDSWFSATLGFTLREILK